MKNYTEFTLEEIKNCINVQQIEILNLYLNRVKQKDIIAKLGCTRGQIDTLVKKFKLTRFRSRNNYTLNENNLHINNLGFCYFLGWFASDGNLHTTNSNTDVIQFTLKDKEPLQKLIQVLEYTGEIKEYKKLVKTSGPENIYYHLAIANKTLVKVINNIFGQDMHNKTYFISIPKFDNEKELLMFIRGFWDGDGCFTLNHANNCKSATAHCASDIFRKQFCEEMQKINIQVANINSKPCPEIRIYKKEDFKKFVTWLYSIEPELCLTRKKEKAFNLLQQL